MQKLREHYDGAATRSRRVQEALEKLKICHYKSEMSFSFDKYVTTLKDCFATLEEDDEGRTDKDKVGQLLNGIQCTQLSAAVSNLNMNEALHTNFEMAANLLQREVHRVFPFAQGKDKRGVSEVNATDGDGTEEEVRHSARNYSVRGRVTFGRGRGRDSQRGGREGRGSAGDKTIINGVDVTNVNRTFTDEEWNKLQGSWDYIANKRGYTVEHGREDNRHGGQFRGGRFGQRVDGRGRGNMGDACSIQAMHQALGELSASLQQGDDMQDQEQQNNAGNSFGATSYGGW